MNARGEAFTLQMWPWEGASQCAGKPLGNVKGSEIVENRAPLGDLGFCTFYLQPQHWNSLVNTGGLFVLLGFF